MRMLIRFARLPLLAFLLILEPVVRVMLSGLALACLVCAGFFRFMTHVADFPFLGMLGVSITCILLLKAYYAVLRLVI